MCYSAQIVQDYRKYVRAFGAEVSLEEFYELFWRRQGDPKIKIPKAMAAAFASPQGADERVIAELIAQFDAQEVVRLEQELFKQRRRLADAQRALLTKATKAATESRRIAADKVDSVLARLADLWRTEPEDRDSRIFPGHYASVMVMERGRRVVMPMRYQCRPAGKPAFYDVKYPGTYNARRDNLEGFWKGQFGQTHAVTIVSAFYENVDRNGKNVVLEFKPHPRQEMLIACLWSRWKGRDEPDLLSFAAITDEPPPEVSQAGHDRCIIPIKPEHVDAWLNPDPANLDALYAILDDRERPYYENRMAA